MKEKYTAEVLVAAALTSSSEQLSYLTCICRSLCQTLAITAIETIRDLAPHGQHDADLTAYVRRFEQPSDGLPVELLDVAVPIIRSHVSKTFMVGWFEDVQGRGSISQSLARWVEFRNRKPGHGVVSKADADEWAATLLSLLQDALSAFQDDLPTFSDGHPIAKVGSDSVVLSTPIAYEHRPIVITKANAKKGIWKLTAQTLEWEKSRDVTLDLPATSIFSIGESPTRDKFRLVDVPNGEKARSVFTNVPVRQTSTFEGRSKELCVLQEWLADREDSRFCLVYGDGGFGKTTLVLEFLNSLLEGEEGAENLPSLISYYTAKQTRWTDGGLVHIKGISDAMEDSVRELLHCIYPVLAKDWFKVQGPQLIDRIAADLKEQGFSRDDVLLVLDNTETLATSPAEVDELAEFLKKVGKRLGRVILTSRRREFLPATPVQISSLSDEESERLMRRLASEYGAKAILQAGGARLRHVAKVLSNKPLLIDTLVKYIARSSLGIDEALEQIFKRTSDELLEFLYEDAWVRMGDLQQDVFLVLVAMANPIDNYAVADACTAIGIQHVEFQSSLDETYFAKVTDYGARYELELVDLAKNFFLQKLKKMNEIQRARMHKIAGECDQLVLRREAVEREYKADRVADAFRSHYAKAAKIATDRGDLAGARENFELALIDEPMNAALRDRYAWFLLNRLQRAEDAKRYAEEAVRLDRSNADASLTLALAYYRLGNIQAGDIEISAARVKGKPEALCYLRMAIARYHAAKRLPYSREAVAMLKDADQLLQRAKKLSDPFDNFFSKNMASTVRYQNLVKQLQYMINAREVSAKEAPGGP